MEKQSFIPIVFFFTVRIKIAKIICKNHYGPLLLIRICNIFEIKISIWINYIKAMRLNETLKK